MHGVSAQDPGRPIDWGRTSADYSRHRPGFPPSFYERIAALGVGLSGERVLDLGTGTGALARGLARRGCEVTGIDISPEQVGEAKRLAEQDGLPVAFHVRTAEDTGLVAGSFDLVAAAQCWLYFDRDRVVAEVKRLLAPGGRLVTCHLCWLPRQDEMARRSEALVLQHNPRWTAADWSGEVPACPAWVRDDFVVTAMFFYDERIPFTRESWRGRFRACRGVGAALTPDEVERFDRDHAALLDRTVPAEFAVLHRIDAHVLAVR